MPDTAKVKGLRQKLRRTEVKLKEMAGLKAEVKAQAKTIGLLEKKLGDYEEMVVKNKKLAQKVKRLEARLDVHDKMERKMSRLNLVWGDCIGLTTIVGRLKKTPKMIPKIWEIRNKCPGLSALCGTGSASPDLSVSLFPANVKN